MEAEKKGAWRVVLGMMFCLIAIFLLLVYWFAPFNSVDFTSSGNSNFNIDNTTTEMQFYENMRYPDYRISYRIIDCPLQKNNDMKWALEILENRTVLDFYESNNEEISITCEDDVKLKEGLFIAGEGGPTKIIQAGNFNVIMKGKILLLRNSECSTPNVAIHELLHALGFDHSSNPNNIMYNFSNCRQTIGEDTIETINRIYSIESLPDLILKNASALMHGRYIDFNVSIINNGLSNSDKSSLELYVDNDLVKSFEVGDLEIGQGVAIKITNVRANNIEVESLKFVLDYSSEELNKKNNEIELKVSD